MIEARPYQTQDFDGVIALYQNKPAYGGNYDPDRDSVDRLQATSEQGNLYVAYAAETLVGTCMILDNPHSFWLLRFAVDPGNSQADEASEALFGKAVQIARDRGHKHVIVYTEEGNEVLDQRYAKLGCQRADAYRCYYKEVTA